MMRRGMKNRACWLALLAAALLATACAAEDPAGGSSYAGVASRGELSATLSSVDTSGMDFSVPEEDVREEYDAEHATTIAFSGSQAEISGRGAVLSDGVVTISAAGTYVFSGSGEQVSVTVDAEKNAVVLVLNGVTLRTADRPVLYVRSAKQVTITRVSGTENRFADGDRYEKIDGSTHLDAAVFSREDLIINGSGTLTVEGNAKHAVVSKDSLVIAGGTLVVTARNVGINGKDFVKVTGAAIQVTAGTDGIRSDRTEDPALGYIYLEKSILQITAGSDGIQAETVLKTVDCEITMVCGGGSDASLSSSASAKGLHAGRDVLVDGGTYRLNCADDGLHAGGSVAISGGELTIATGDDGVHADADVAISGGKVVVTQSHEGLEGVRVLLSGGETCLTADDDGINATSSSSRSSDGEIRISGGYHVVYASGDGLDANGSITISGGVTLVSGSSTGGNGALDYDVSATVTGGILIALGDTGMAQNVSAVEQQGAMLVSVGQQSGESSFAVCDDSGRVIASMTAPKAYRCAVVSAPALQLGKTYTLLVGGTVEGADEHGFAQDATLSGGTVVATVTLSSWITGGTGFAPGGFGGGGFGPGGGPGPRW